MDTTVAPRTIIVTTSWDDGHQCDLRLAELLKSHGLSGTFYVSPSCSEFDKRDLLTEQQIHDIGREFEVGSHTLTHPRLPDIPIEDAVEEITSSKQQLEDVTGKCVTSFCYPYGAYNPVHRDVVRDAGYLFARTVSRYEFDLRSPLDAPTSIHAYNHWTDLWKMAKFSRFNVSEFLQYRHWDHLSDAMFDYVLEAGGIYHLWGHSWEIDEHDDWRQLDKALGYLSGRPGVTYLTNGQLASSMPPAQSSPSS